MVGYHLKIEGNHLVFAKDIEFSSPSMAASVVHGGAANGLIAWKNGAGKSLKKIEQYETGRIFASNASTKSELLTLE